MKAPTPGVTRLTVPEVAEELRCSERFVVDELRAKSLRGLKIGGRWLVEKADLDRYLSARANIRPVRRSA